MLVHFHGAFAARLLGEEELDGVGRGAAVVFTGEEDRNVYCEDILRPSQESKHILGEEAVSLVQLQLIE